MNFLEFLGWKKMSDDASNVVKFPEPKAVPPAPKVEDTAEAEARRKKEEDDTTPVYQVGKTATGRVSLRLGNGYHFTTITMNNEGVDTLVRMLVSAKEQVYPEGEADEES